MIVYGILIPLTIIDGFAMGYFSVLCGDTKAWVPFLFLVLTNILPLWALISRFSTNLIFDELLFDVSLMIPYLIVVLVLDNYVFTPINFVGLIVAFIGFILLKLQFSPKSIEQQKSPA
jgi:fumarate reductase subunit D